MKSLGLVPLMAASSYADALIGTWRLEAEVPAQKRHGHGTESVPGGTIPLMQALIAGEINVSMEE